MTAGAKTTPDLLDTGSAPARALAPAALWPWPSPGQSGSSRRAETGVGKVIGVTTRSRGSYGLVTHRRGSCWVTVGGCLSVEVSRFGGGSAGLARHSGGTSGLFLRPRGAPAVRAPAGLPRGQRFRRGLLRQMPGMPGSRAGTGPGHGLTQGQVAHSTKGSLHKTAASLGHRWCATRRCLTGRG